MKRIILLLSIFIGSLIPSSNLYASHGMGGEVTWTCLPSGQFRFELKFYRDCNGIPGPASISLTTTVPGVPNIPLPLFDQNDISPVGLASNGITACATCAQGNGSNPPIPGLVEEFIYRSAPINLPGVPPATGWVFSWGECCRSSSLTNITGGGGIGFQNRAIMYPYLGTNTQPCFDSSPFFAEKPSTIICTGYPFKYNPNAVDPELDSLVYSWGQPLDESGGVIPFAPGYNVNSQLPSATQNPANSGAVMNPNTGEVNYTSFTGGYFATVVKVTAYKCGIKVAEVFREINVVLNNNCPPVMTGPNFPPAVNAPFYNPVTGLQTAYADTVYAGDTVNFILAVTDFDIFNSGVGQTITVEGSGSQFGTNFTNPNTGCLIPPCATVSPALPFSFAIGGQVTFNWVTTCDHVKGLDTLCTRISNTYHFVIKASDNYCPANATNVGTFSITILPPPELKAPVLRCASVNTDGSVALSWTKPAVRDSQNTFYSYEIYASLAAGGPWQLVDSVKTPYLSPATYSYTHTLLNLTAMFGTNAQQQSIYYHIKTISGCFADSISDPSNILRTIKLNANLNGANETVLTWNALSTPPLSSHALKYKIYKQFPVGVWALIDSTALLTYTDITTKLLCNDTVSYRVELSDSTGCISKSSLDGVQIINPNPIATIVPVNPSFCAGGSVILTCNTPGNSYVWSTGSLTNTTTVNASNTYTVTVTQNGGCTSVGSTTVTVNPLPNPTITGNNSICAGDSVLFNAGGPYASYVWNGGATSQSIYVSVSGTYTVTVTDANGCSKSTTRNLVVNANPVPNITGVATICQGNTTILNAGAFPQYLWSTGAAITQTVTVGNAGNYTVTVTNAAGCTGTDVFNVVVNPLPNPVITGDNSICAGFTTTLTAGPVPYNIYLWSNNAGAQSITTGAANTYTVTVTDVNGCTNTDDIVLTVNPNPVPVIIGNNIICQGQTATFNAGPGFTYEWSNGAFTQSTNISIAGPYTVTVTDANGCIGVAVRNLVVNANPTPVINGTTTFCQGLNYNLNAGIGYTDYLWSGGATTQLLNVTNSGTYTVTVTNANGCTGTDSQVVTVNPLPTPTISGDLSICQGFNTTLTANAGYPTYQWSTGVNTQTINLNTATTVTVTVTDLNGCTNNTSVTTVVNPNPVPVIIGNNIICQGQSTSFNAGPGYTYLWSNGALTQTTNVNTAGPYTVTVTDANGCVGYAVRNLTVNAIPTAAISGIDTICAGQATSIQVNFGGPGPYTYTYFDGVANQGPFTTGAAVANIPVSPAATSGYTLVNVSNANCTGTISGIANISVTPLPTAQITGTTDICIGGNTNVSINFTGVGPYTYSYTAGATVFGPFTTSNDPEIINVLPGTTTTYGLTATVIGAGCVGNTNPATATVTVNSLPTVAVTGNNTICSGEPTDLIFNFTGTGPYTYSYSNGTTTFGPFTTPNDPATVTVTPGITTTYTPVSISDANCTGSVAGAAAITVNPLPSATISGTAAICDGASTDLSILFTGTGPYSYSYNDGTNIFGPFVTNQNPVIINVSPNNTTTYGITTVSDANCTGNGAGSAAITVIPLPTSDLTGTTEICRGDDTDLILNFTGIPPFEYGYSDGGNTYGPFTTNNFSTNINVSPINNTSYVVTFLTGSGCQGTPSGVVDITVNSIPDADLALSGDDVLCDGESSEFTINFTGIAPYTYTYTDGFATFGPFTTSNNPEIIPVTPSVSSNYGLITYSDDKCIGTMAGTALVTVNPLPVAAVSGNSTICDGSGTSFTIGFTGTGPFTYSYSNGSSSFGPFTTPNNPEIITVAPTVTTSYNVVTISDANCTGSSSGVAEITVNQIPTASLTGDAEICRGEATGLSIAFTGVAPFTYTYFNGTNNIGPVTVASSPANIQVAPALSTSYTLIAINDANCPGTLSGSADVTVNQLPQPLITGDFEICDGESSVLVATPGFTTYTWSNGSATPSIVSTTPGIFTVSVIDNNGCEGTSPAINFIVNQTPVISFTNDTSLTCEIPSINFFNTSSYPSGSEFSWNFGDNGTSELPNPSHLYSLPGNYPVTLTISTPAGCTATLSQPVEITFFPLPVADFSYAPSVTNVFNGRVDFVDESEYAVSWFWEFGDGGKSADKNTFHYYNEIGEYKVTLTVTNIAGCIDQKEEIVIINPFYIPNAFTPNADGINDYFFDAGYVLEVKSFKMNIFSRWGDKVYEGDDYTNFWNGYDQKGNKSPGGVYVYTIEVITIGGKEHKFTGTV
ncbi:MAG: PKD domain-containing protein, partial [Bacteroidota bacterium]|nr:PKD domain-containing protein [Bacteroidota bacterium]